MLHFPSFLVENTKPFSIYISLHDGVLRFGAPPPPAHAHPEEVRQGSWVLLPNGCLPEGAGH